MKHIIKLYLEEETVNLEYSSEDEALVAAEKMEENEEVFDICRIEADNTLTRI